MVRQSRRAHLLRRRQRKFLWRNVLVAPLKRVPCRWTELRPFRLAQRRRDRSFLLYEVLEWSEGAPAKVRQWTPVDGHEGRFELKPGTPTRQDQELRYWTRQNWYEVKHEVGSQAPPQVTLPEQSSQVTAAFQALGASRR